MVVDPFAGGGVIALSALLRGHRVVAQELDPWAARNLASMSTPGSSSELATIERAIDTHIRERDAAYRTVLSDGTPGRIAHTLRVAVTSCPNRRCSVTLHLYPTSLVSRLSRIDTKHASQEDESWFACPAGHLYLHPAKVHRCPQCHRRVDPHAHYTARRKIMCWSCSESHSVTGLLRSGVLWRAVLVQRTRNGKREIDRPSIREIEKSKSGSRSRCDLAMIPDGSDTSVLIRSGFEDYSDLYPSRQLALLGLMLDAVESCTEVSTWARDVARSCVIGAAEFAGYATRWDARYLKPYETLASHRYNVTSLSAEIDPWGDQGRGTVRRRLNAAARAARWLAEQGVPKYVHARSSCGPVAAPGVGLTVVTGSSSSIPLPDASVDLVLTDPPYHDDVQYSDLASLFRAWDGEVVGRLSGDVTPRRNQGEIGLQRFQEALRSVFVECRRITRRSGHLVLSFANRSPHAWIALISALDSSGWHSVGFDVVHSENESEHSKSGKRSCTLDVILDLVPIQPRSNSKHSPRDRWSTSESRYCFMVGRTTLQIGALLDGWEGRFVARLESSDFIRSDAGRVVKSIK